MRLPIPSAAVPPSVHSTCARLMRGCAKHASSLVNAAGRRLKPVDADLAAVRDLFVEHAYVGEITADGRYIDHTSGPAFPSYVGGDVSADTERGPLWESLIAAADRPAYESFNRRLLTGRAAEVTYRLVGLDGVTRTIWDRARAVPHPDGSATVRGIISDVSERVAANARAAEAAERFERLLDVVGEHVYLAAVLDDGTMREIFQGPGADRLLGGAEPDPEMTNWEAAIHP
jgi:PAS domain-containing protein